MMAPRPLAALLLAVPALIAFIVLAWVGALAPGTAATTFLLVALATVALATPLFLGLARVRRAVQSMAENEAARPEVESASPAVRELWLDIMRWTRAARAKAAAREAEIDTAQLVLHHLPDPLVVLDGARRIARTNAGPTRCWGRTCWAATSPWRCASRRCWPPPTRCCAARATGWSSSISRRRWSIISRRGSCR
jgi:hypothetical protein